MTDLFQSADDLGEYLFRIIDNGGASADRYTVAISDGDGFTLSGAPSHPQGVSMSIEGLDPAYMETEVAEGRAVDLGWHDLPSHIRAHVISRLNEGWRGYLADLESGETPIPAERAWAEENEGIHNSGGKGIYGKPGAYFVRRDGPAEDDRGPFPTVRDALLATMPDHYGLAGPEYHSTATSGAREAGAPSPEVAAAVAALEARVEVGGDGVMPKFILNTPPTADDFRRAVAYGYAKPVKGRKVHPFHSLDEFARGYVEAMFFTNCDSGDERENLANDLGVERLTRASVATIKEDCDAFQAAAAAEIKATLAHGETDLAAIGRDFWFTRQHHGVGFWEGESRGYPGEIGDDLDRIAESFGEVYPQIYRGWIYHR